MELPYTKHAWRSALGHNLSHLRVYRSGLEADQCGQCCDDMSYRLPEQAGVEETFSG